MGWRRLGAQTLSALADVMNIPLENNTVLTIPWHKFVSGQTQFLFRFNNDAGTNYAHRTSQNGAADTTSTSQAQFVGYFVSTDSDDRMGIIYVVNLPNQEKLAYQFYMENNTNGAANAPERFENVIKWANTTEPIINFSSTNTTAGDIATDSNISIMGWKTTRPRVESFASMYESRLPLTQVKRQHFVEWFSGKALDAIWLTDGIQGTGTYAMVDEINEGFSITGGGTAADFGVISFNNIRQYSETACISLQVLKAGTNGDVRCGLNNTIASAASMFNSAFFRRLPADSNFSLATGDASTSTSTATSVPKDTTTFHLSKIVCGTADIKLSVDGKLEVTKTTNRPAARLQPFMGSRFDGGAGSVRVRYCEVYNT